MANADSANADSVSMLVSLATGVVIGAICAGYFMLLRSRKVKVDKQVDTRKDNETHTVELLPCIRARRSVFPRSYVDREIEETTVNSLLEAAMWAPFHGPRPPWRFVVLGRSAMVAMQELTLEFYDKNWRETGWCSGKYGAEADYLKWRRMTEDEITGRWGPVSYMIAIVMQRQAGSKRVAEWEEAAATACAVQNMGLQASAFPGLACYWSSWHPAARDSDMMRDFLKMGAEDKCLGFFIVAACDADLKDRRVRQPESHLAVEWRK